MFIDKSILRDNTFSDMPSMCTISKNGKIRSCFSQHYYYIAFLHGDKYVDFSKICSSNHLYNIDKYEERLAKILVESSKPSDCQSISQILSFRLICPLNGPAETSRLCHISLEKLTKEKEIVCEYVFEKTDNDMFKIKFYI